MCTLRERVEMGLDTNLVDRAGQKRAAWVRRNRSLFISLGIHAALFWVAGLIVFGVIARQEQAAVVCQKEVRDDRFYDEPLNSFVRTPRVEARVVEKPVVQVEQEIEITRDVPDGLSFDYLSNKNLGADGCIDVYSFAAGAAGAYGMSAVKEVLESDTCG